MSGEIGKRIGDNKDIFINLEKLVATRMLIQANSGGGKSWLARKIIENFSGRIQQIVIDLEGEFSTLREKFDFLLVGKEGEVPCNIQTAELLAKRLLKLNVSTIIDLSELKHPERVTFVKRFLDSLINSPKELWHPLLVYIDEAHQFCSEGKSASGESKPAVIDLMTRGRKRGFSGILMTQRISKLDKDACAEANNKFIGRATLDVDRKRAGEELGFTSKDDERSLRDLKAGEFYVFGSAISELGINKIEVGDVKTTHPDRTRGIQIKPSSTPENIKRLLKNIIDLPKEAKQEFSDKKEMREEIIKLRQQLTIAHKNTNKEKINVIDGKTIEKARRDGWKECEVKYSVLLKELQEENRKIYSENKHTAYLFAKAKEFFQTAEIIEERQPISRQTPKYEVAKVGVEPIPLAHETSVQPPHPNRSLYKKNNIYNPSERSPFNICSRRIYSFLYKNPGMGFSRVQTAVMTGYSIRSSGFVNAISQLNTSGLIRKEGDKIYLESLDESVATEPSHAFNPENILNQLSKCPREIMQVLLDNPSDSFTRQEVAEKTQQNYSIISSGFINAISKLSRMGLLIKDGINVKLNPEILEL